MSGSPEQPYARITLVLPDDQSVEVRLYQRLQTTGRFPWRFRIGIPSWVATEAGVEPAEYSVWVTDRQLRPIDGVDLSVVPTHRCLESRPPAKPSDWVVCHDPQRLGGTLVHDAACRHANGGGRELGSMEALDALMRPGAKACHECAAAEILLLAMESGCGYG